MTSFFITSLGCPKNLVDSQRLHGQLSARGLEPAASEEAARILIVNTCGFIRAACEESLEAVLSLAALKAKGAGRLLVVAGCLPGRYGEELKGQLPEVDLFFGPLTSEAAAAEAAGRIAAAAGLSEATASPESGAAAGQAPTTLLTPPWRAYVKIAEGCSNHCTYCTIPAIRGRRRSRPLADIAAEVATLAAAGVREVTLVAQDTSAWGGDLRPRAHLADLLERLAEAPVGPDWLRLLYLHPERVDGRLIRAMSAGGRILPYFDMPVQHASAKVLRAMARPYDSGYLLRLIERVRGANPQAVLRTSVMVGFPGENERDLKELLDFTRRAAFDHLGCFVFSPEENTPAAQLRPRVSGRVAERRRAAVMEHQADISRGKNEALVGQTLSVLVEEAEGGRIVGRAGRHAPEIDGQVLAEGRAKAGEIVPVRLTGAAAYDLEGVLLERG